ncbi:hypothetical protein QOT17_014784 [Balamuthia mandrillaris]
MEAADTQPRDPLRVKESLREIFDRRAAKGELIFAMLAGSQAFNLAVATSDEDWFGIYAGDIEATFGLQAPAPSLDGNDPDYAIYEVSKYAELLLKGNPKVIEPLFAKHNCWTHPLWHLLQNKREAFLTQTTLAQYVKYSRSQLHDAKELSGQPKHKKLCHALRLMREAYRISRGEGPMVWFEGEERDYLLSIRSGAVDENSILQELTELQETIEKRKESLPARTDPSLLDQWIEQVRLQSISSNLWQNVPPSFLDQQEHISSSSLALKQRAEDLLSKHGVNNGARVLCCIPSGSKAHGLAIRNKASEDYIGVFVVDTPSVLRMKEAVRRVDEVGGLQSKQKEIAARGMLLLEASHACRLLCQGHHRLVEALFWDQQEEHEEEKEQLVSYESETWLQLKRCREEILSGPQATAAIDHCCGVSTGLLQRKPTTAIAMYHAMRLLLEAEHLIREGRPQVRLRDEEERQLLLSIRDIDERKNDEELDKVKEKVVQKLEQVSSLRNSSNTKTKKKNQKEESEGNNNKIAVNNWLASLRIAQWKQQLKRIEEEGDKEAASSSS